MNFVRLVEEAISIEQDIKQLVNAVEDWASYGIFTDTIDPDLRPHVRDNLIRKYTDMFAYEGPLFRFMGVPNKGDVTRDNVREAILKHEKAKELNSWSETQKGAQRFRDHDGGDYEFNDDEKSMFLVYCTQQGKGFSITKFYNFLKQNYPEIKNIESIESCLEVKEVIAPYYDNFTVKVSRIDKNPDYVKPGKKIKPFVCPPKEKERGWIASWLDYLRYTPEEIDQWFKDNPNWYEDGCSKSKAYYDYEHGLTKEEPWNKKYGTTTDIGNLKRKSKKKEVENEN